MAVHGQVAALEISAKDVARAVDFYSKTFGWKFEAPQAAIPTSQMMTFEEGGKIFSDGAVIQQSDTIPTSGFTKIYINVDNMQSAAEAVTKNGGTIVGPVVKVLDIVVYQFFKDTEGNLNAISNHPKA